MVGFLFKLADRMGERNPFTLAELPPDILIYWMAFHDIKIIDNSQEKQQARLEQIWGRI